MKAYDQIHWMATWDVLKVNVMGRSLLNRLKAFNKDAKTFSLNREMNESFGIQGV